MSVPAKDLEKALVQLRRIEEHREVGAEKEIRRLYKALLKDLKQFIGLEYAELAEDGKLTYEILNRKGEYARFLEEVERKVNGISPAVQREITGLVEETYEAVYTGMQKAVMDSVTSEELQAAFQGLRAVTPEAVKSVVEQGLVDEVLKKNWQDNIYEIKRVMAVGLANGDRSETMARRLAETLDTSYKKAVRIARTESHRARESGFDDCGTDINETLKQGITDVRMVKIWRTMQDERVRPNVRRKTKKGWKTYRNKGGANHEVMDGVMVAQDEMFTLSDGTETAAPGKSGVAGQDINCRCYVSRRLMKDSEFFAATGRHFDGF